MALAHEAWRSVATTREKLESKVGMWRRDRSAWVQAEVQRHVTWAREGKDVAPENGKSNYAQVFPGRRLRQFAGDSITCRPSIER